MKFRRKGKEHTTIKDIKLDEDTTIGIVQGEFGNNKDLDIRVVYVDKNTKNKNVPRTPQHIHWAIDLLIKKEHKKELTKRFVKYLLEMWDKVEAFKNKAEQQKCEIKYCLPEKLKEFEELNNYGEYKVEFIACVLELLMIQEKTGNAKAHMFKGVLQAIYDDKDIFSIVSKAGFKGAKK